MAITQSLASDGASGASGTSANPDAELTALGWANVAAAWSSGFAVTGERRRGAGACRPVRATRHILAVHATTRSRTSLILA